MRAPTFVILFFITCQILQYPHSIQGCNSHWRYYHKITPLASLNKTELPSLQLPATNFLSTDIVESQIETINYYNELKGFWKKVIDKAVAAIPYKFITVPINIFSGLLLKIESTAELEKKLEGLDVDKKLLINELSHLNASFEFIRWSVENANDVNLTIDSRRDFIHSAFEEAQKILLNFREETNPLAQSKALTFPYFTNFATRAGIVGGYVTVLSQDQVHVVREHFKDIRDLLKIYGTEGWTERVKDVRRVRNPECKYIGSKRCLTLSRRDTNTDDPSFCYLPDEAYETPEENQYCEYNWNIRDVATNQILCYEDTRCYNSYMTKLKEEFHTMVDVAFATIQDPTLYNSSTSLALYFPSTDPHIPLEESCSLNYISPGSIPPIDYGRRSRPEDDGRAEILQVMGAFLMDGVRTSSEDFVCRQGDAGNVYPGESDGFYCWYPAHRTEVEGINSDILAHTWAWRESKKLKWKTRRDVVGENFSSAVVVGKDENDPLYVGRCFRGAVTGYVSGGITYVAVHGREEHCQNPWDLILVCE